MTCFFISANELQMLLPIVVKSFFAVGLQISADSPDDVRVRYWDRRSAPLPNLQLCDQDQAIFVIRRKVSSRERVKLNVLHGTPIAI
jgi:hypothetical protein